MKKRFKYVSTTPLKEQYTAALEQVVELQMLIVAGIPENALKNGLAMGTGKAAKFCRTANGVGLKYSNLIDEDADFTIQEMTDRREFADFWDATRTLRTTISNNETLIEGAYGRDLMEMAQYIKDNLEPKKAMPKYKADYDNLNMYYTERAEVTKSTTATNQMIKEAQVIIDTNKSKE